MDSYRHVNNRKSKRSKKIVSGSSSNLCCLIWRGTNQLEFYKENITHKYKIKNEEIKENQSGYSTFLILTVSGLLLNPEINKIKKKIKKHNTFQNNQYTTKQLYAAGLTYSSVDELSSEKPNQIISPKKVDDWKASEILDIFCFSSSVLITKEGKAYGCGSATSGCGKVETRFKEIPLLKDKKVVKISGGYATVCVLTSENELYGWNFNTNNQPTEQYQNNKEVWNKPRKINVPEYFIKNSLPLNFSFGTENIFLYQDLDVSTLKQDFKKFYESKKYCDSKLIASRNEEIPIHKIIVELRTNLKIEEINEIFLKNTFS
ncbi:hypothetical protein M0812_09732 [Anaeramoeba flamelloides]|uniref:Uncharacterized protein n=1 Tax=Anaeramoeba flamelloides TaxID=1746091 RepID=A0AAV7ZRZ7_9EUKA|nr:hypothetical protein M0812_09732 [Anaeramoeba flamelloides]